MNGDSQLLPGDRNWAEDKVLLADLSNLNGAVARYVLRQLDVDARQAEPIPPDEERALGLQLVELGNRIQGRAAASGTNSQAGRMVERGRLCRVTRPAPWWGTSSPEASGPDSA